jgi:hypothetical protein
MSPVKQNQRTFSLLDEAIMPLANLPLELKLNIAECLDPISCFDFSIACWHHWAFCEPIVQKHAHLYAENRCIDANFAGTLLWTKLKKILQDPRLGWYVRELNLPANRRVYWDPDTAHDWQLTPQSQRLPEQELHIFHSAAEDLRPIYAVSRSEVDVVECIERDLAGGSDEAVIAILVHHLPLLKILRITDLNIGNCFKLMVENVALNYDNPANASVLPFKRLESVSMAHWDSEYACSPDWALKFGSIPSVQNFVGLAMGSDGSGGFWDGPEGRLSNIKELFLVRCQFSIPSLENVFKSIKTLEKFSYEAGGSLVSYSSYEAKRVIEALAICQGHSLEHLYLDDADDMHEDVCIIFPQQLTMNLLTARSSVKVRRAFHCKTLRN